MDFKVDKCVDGRDTYLAKSTNFQDKKFLLFQSGEELFVEAKESITLNESNNQLSMTGLPDLIPFINLGVFSSEEEALNSLK